MTNYFRVIVFFVISATELFSQPLNNSDIIVLSDTTIFQPGTFEACHASTIVETTAGTFMAAWFAGSYEGANDVGIWISTFKNNQWSEPIEAAKGTDSVGNQLPCWNPVLFKTKNNSLILFYKVGVNPRLWWGEAKLSSDEGKTWSEPQKLPEGFLGPIKDKPIQLCEGNILCPSSVETPDGIWSVHLEITNEDLSRWEKIEIKKDDSVGVIQPTIIEHPDNRLQMLCRSRQNLVYETWSEDAGLHWSKLSKTNLPNPNSGIDAVSLNNGKFLLIYNPLLQGVDWFYGRNVLNVAISENGENWQDIYQLENEKEGEFSYPAVIQASDNSIHITYTARRKTIKHVVLKFRE